MPKLTKALEYKVRPYGLLFSWYALSIKSFLRGQELEIVTLNQQMAPLFLHIWGQERHLEWINELNLERKMKNVMELIGFESWSARCTLWCFGSYADMRKWELHLHECRFNKKPYFYQYFLSYKVSICENVWIFGIFFQFLLHKRGIKVTKIKKITYFS